MSYRATYARRFNERGIRRPRRYVPMTDEQVDALPEPHRTWARVNRDLRAASQRFGSAVTADMMRQAWP